MTRQELEQVHIRSGPVQCRIGEYLVHLMPKVFKTGSLGWHGQAKIRASDTDCQLNVVLTVIGSKPDEEPKAEENKGSRTGHLAKGRKRPLEGPKPSSNGKAEEVEPETPQRLLGE